MLSSVRYSFFIVAAIPLFRSVSGDAACYYPNGDLSPDDVPCNSSAEASVCCGRGWMCLSNGVCMLSQDSTVGSISGAHVGSTYRASCTDRSWNSTKCPSFCKTSPWKLDVYQAISSCGEHSWCCQNKSTNEIYCCNLKNQTFNLDDIQEKSIQISLTGDPLSYSTLSNSTTISNSTGIHSASTGFSSRIIALSIGLGVPFVLTLIICFLLLVRAHQAASAHKQNELDHKHWKSLSGLAEMNGDGGAAEMSGHQKFELHGGEMPVEVPA